MLKKQVKCSECGFLGLRGFEGTENIVFKWQEIQPQERINLSKTSKDLLLGIGCLRGQDHVIAGVPLPNEFISQDNLIKNSYFLRKCIYYYRYNPGHTPEQHLELQRDAKTRRTLISGMISAAVIGAIIGALISKVVG